MTARNPKRVAKSEMNMLILQNFVAIKKMATNGRKHKARDAYIFIEKSIH